MGGPVYPGPRSSRCLTGAGTRSSQDPCSRVLPGHWTSHQGEGQSGQPSHSGLGTGVTCAEGLCRASGQRLL